MLIQNSERQLVDLTRIWPTRNSLNFFALSYKILSNFFGSFLTKIISNFVVKMSVKIICCLDMTVEKIKRF